MCGILLTTRAKNNPLILDSIKHRGIERTEIELDQVTLCHHRLPIQTSDGDEWTQPRELSPGVFMMFNGEIFNYDKNQFSSDTEYLCHLFRGFNGSNIEFFTAMYQTHIQMWDGFWAIVFYDSRTGEVLAFTDPLGKKSLYINDLGEICSEIKGLRGPLDEIDEIYISSVRKWGYNKDNRTPFKSIKRILPNTFYSYNIQSPWFPKTFGPYYRTWESPILELDGASYEDHMNWLWDKMFESVQNRLVSKNYPISLLVSGGLDSSIIAAILKHMDAKVAWFSIENGETPFINDLEAHIGVQTNFLEYDMDSSKNSLIYTLWNETPVDLGSVIPQYHLFDAVKKKSGYRIVLSGDGSDELFGGYSRIHDYDSQKSDIFEELTFYHLPRLDKMSMAHTLELRNPFLNLDILRFSAHLPIEWRTDKKILKDTFGPLLPDTIVNRKKEALKNPEIKDDKLKYRQKAVDLFLSSIK
jgi:asparagine synthase (glutamine-hydrolysing)